MLNRLAWILLAQLSFIFSVADEAGAEVSIQSRPSPLQIEAANYQAQVDWDGCLTSLRVYGQEFLAANVSVSRGSYFYHQGPLQLSDIKQPATDTITAKGDLTSVEYSFANDRMVWQLANQSEEKLVFFIVFAGSLDGLKGGEGKIQTAPITANAGKLVCYQGAVRLEIDGFTRIWGPWQGPHQVGQVDLGPGEKKEIEIQFGKLNMKERREIVKLNTLPPDSAITVLAPRSYQVFQRHSVEEGEVLVSGRCNVDVDKLEIRILGQSKHGRLPNEWTFVPIVSSIREFNVRLSIPAGGWYSLELRATKAGKVVAEEMVDRFGVGEVFVGGGQSNSTNCGEFKTQQTTGMVSSFGGEKWQIADDPQLGVADRTQGGSFWPAFGDAMYEKYQVPIGVATTGYGGTSVNQWQADGDLFKWMMTRVHQLGPGGFRALLWHQGESDVAMTSDEYYAKLKNVIVASRDRAGWEFPWFVAQASYHNPEKLKFESVRSAQQRLWDDAVALVGPDTDTLTGDHRDLGGKGIHLSPKGLKAHGEMWAERVGGYLDEVLAIE